MLMTAHKSAPNTQQIQQGPTSPMQTVMKHIKAEDIDNQLQHPTICSWLITFLEVPGEYML